MSFEGLTVPKDVLKNFFLTEKLVYPRFSGMGKFRIKREYTPEEEVILKYFFTNTDSNIYAATDNMPNQLWALLMGQYARSSLTARDRLLNIFYEMHNKALEQKQNDSSSISTWEVNTLSLKSIADTISSSKSNNIGLALNRLLAKAGTFIEFYGVKYGHASLRDSDIIRMCFEGVSQRATKFLELAREGAYQEPSTRAIPFTAENLGIPLEIRGTIYEKVLLDLGKDLIKLYEKINSSLQIYLNDKHENLRKLADEKIKNELKDNNAKLPDRSWQSIINGKAFDVARYLIPQNMTTSLGMTLNTRRFQDMLTYWQSLPHWEMQVIGKAAQIEAMKISPNLMKHGNPSEYYKEIPERKINLFDEIIEPRKNGIEQIIYEHQEISTKLISSTPEIETLVLTSILFSAANNVYSFEALKGVVKNLSFEERRKIAETHLNTKGEHDLYPKDMEVGGFVFERTYDIGAFRDLQRQRGDRQQTAPYVIVGYNMPDEIKEIGMESEFKHMMNRVKEVHDTLYSNVSPFVAEYALVMANLVRQVVTKDPVQHFYEAGLRTVPQGIDSYRFIEQEETKQILNVMPAFKGLIKCDENYYPLGRLDETVNMYITEELNKRAK